MGSDDMSDDTTLATTIVRLDPRELALIDDNARFMTKDQFLRLVANVRRDGRLTSLPLVAARDDGRLEVLSGNHRTKAAIAAELDEIDVIRIDSELTRGQRRAIQLSHNAIAGQDDPHKLRELFDSIGDLDLREYTGLDDATLDLLMESLEVPPLAATSLQYRLLSIVFLPEQLDAASETLEEVRALTGGADERWLARFVAYDEMLDALDVAARIAGGKNQATAVELVLATFRRHVLDWRDTVVADPAPSTTVASPSIFGWDLPITAARTITAALLRAEADEPWEVVEGWARAALDAGSPAEAPGRL
jgi:ParB-like chromosome segregation protein Spo0J